MFLSPEEKLLELRKKYKITQGELAGEDITRVFLGMIEIGKRSLTEKTAKLLYKNLKNIVESRGIELEISLEEMMKSKEEQAQDFLDELLETKDNICNENIWIIDEALYELPPSKKEEYCDKLYTRFKSRKRYLLAREYLLKSLYVVRQSNDLREKLLDMFELCGKVGDPQGAVYIYRKFSNKLGKFKLIDYDKLKYHYAVALLQSGEIGSAMDVTRELIKKVKCDEGIYLVRSLKARIYKEQKKYDEAIKEYSSLVKGKTPEQKAQGYSKIIEIGIFLKDKETVKKYFDKCRVIVSRNEIKDFDILYALAKGASFIGRTKDAKFYYLTALKVVDKDKKAEENMAISSFLDIVENVDFNIVRDLEKIYLENTRTTKDFYLGLKFLKYYQEHEPCEVEKKTNLYIEKGKEI